MAKKKPQTSRRRSRPVETKKKTNPMMIYGIIGVVVIIAIAVPVIMLNPFGSSANDTPDNTPNDTTDNTSNVTTGTPVATITTSKGIIKVELFEDKMPNTCENFIEYIEADFYDGLTFHRVQDDFMIQGGAFNPDGSMKQPLYDPIALETNPEVLHEDGAISMARTTNPNSATSQFFICDGAQHGLDGQYAAFGIVIEGMDVLRDIADEPHDGSYGSVGGGKPLTDILIEEITIQYQ